MPPQARQLARKLRSRLRARLGFDPAAREREARLCDGQWCAPLGLVEPADEADLILALETAAQCGVPVRVRGAGIMRHRDLRGTLLIDLSPHLNRVIDFDSARARIEVQAGMSLSALDAWLAPHGLRLPVDVPAAPQASLGGLFAVDALLLGNQMHRLHRRIHAVDALLPDGQAQRFGAFGKDGTVALASSQTSRVVSGLFELAAAHQQQIESQWPQSVAPMLGYRLDIFDARHLLTDTAPGALNLAHLLAGSRAELAWTRRLVIDLDARPAARATVLLNFVNVSAALACVPVLRAGAALAIDLYDAPLWCAHFRAGDAADLGLSASSAALTESAAVLLVQFEADDASMLASRLVQVLASCAGLARGAQRIDASRQCALDAWRARTASALFRTDASLAESVPCDNRFPIALLSQAYEGLQAFFARAAVPVHWFGQLHGGVLSFRAASPALAQSMRQTTGLLAGLARCVVDAGGAIAGDMLGARARGHLLEAQFSEPLAGACRQVRALFDPAARISGASDESQAAKDAGQPVPGPALQADSAAQPNWPDSLRALICAGDFACAAYVDAPGPQCPSYLASGREIDSPRGRVATLRAALEGRLGAPASASDALMRAFDSCLACRLCEQPPQRAVPLARMRAEVLAQHARVGKPDTRTRVAQFLLARPRLLAQLGPLIRLRNGSPLLAALAQSLTGLSRTRPWPVWQRRGFALNEITARVGSTGDPLVLWVDTFNARISPEALRAAERVMRAAGYAPIIARPAPDDDAPSQPLCCARQWLDAGQFERARQQARRTVRALVEHATRGVPIVGIEPACTLTIRDDYCSLWPDVQDSQLAEQAAVVAGQMLGFEQWLAQAIEAGRLPARIGSSQVRTVLVQAHCHQQAGGTVNLLASGLRAATGAHVEMSADGCCGMGSFKGFHARHQQSSKRIAEQGVLKRLASLDADTVIVADGFACRCQIGALAGRPVLHSAQLIAAALDEAPDPGVVAGI